MVRLQRAAEMSRFGNWKKFRYLTDNHITVNYYYISRVLRYQKKRRHFVYFFSTSSFVSNFVCFREIIAGFDIDESYNYVEHVSSFVTCSSRASAA